MLSKVPHIGADQRVATRSSVVTARRAAGPPAAVATRRRDSSGGRSPRTVNSAEGWAHGWGPRRPTVVLAARPCSNGDVGRPFL